MASSTKTEKAGFGLLQEDSHSEDRTQYLRAAADKLELAVDEWLSQRHELSFLLTLGDVIDGNATLRQSIEDLERITTVLDRLVRTTRFLRVRNSVRTRCVHPFTKYCFAQEQSSLLSQVSSSALMAQKQIWANLE